jgi:hypothetical protein
MNLLTLLLLATTVALSWPGFTTTRGRALMLLAVVFLPVVSWCYTIPRGVVAHYRGTRTARTMAAALEDIDGPRRAAQREADLKYWRQVLETGLPMERVAAEGMLAFWASLEPEVEPESEERPPAEIAPPVGWVWREDALHGYSDEQAVPVLDERGRTKVRVAVIPLPAANWRDEPLEEGSTRTIGTALERVAHQFDHSATASDFDLLLALNLVRLLGEAIERRPATRETAAATSELLFAARHFRTVLDIRAATGYPPAVIGQPANFDHLH